MILINLLPAEYRQKRRTPLKYMGAVAASVAVNACLLAWWGWTAFGAAAEVKSELALFQDTAEGLEPQVVYHKALEAESGLFRSREETLTQITTSRVSWTEKVDQLVELINRGGEEKYLVWLDDLTVDQKQQRKGSAGQLRASGNSGSENFAHVANFLEDVEESDFARDFGKPKAPEGSETKVDENLSPATVWGFDLELALKSPEERGVVGVAKPGAKPGTAKPGAKPAKQGGK